MKIFEKYYFVRGWIILCVVVYIFVMFLLESKRKHRGHDARRVERCLIATFENRVVPLNDQLAIHRIYSI